LSDAPQRLPNGAVADPDTPGWYSWGDFPRGSFASRTGRLLFRPDGPGRGLARMMPDETHLNMGGSLHGGAVMSFIDMALFAGGRCAGMGEGHYVTLDCSTRFIARGRIGVPLDAHVRLLKQTAGGLVFFDGHCEQEGEICYSFTGTLKRIKSRSETGDEPGTDDQHR
jgi:acyl-coenzyme A thioesterase 13